MTDHCLIVEDEPGIQEFMAKVLQLSGISSTLCSNASEMLKYIQEKEVRLIFLDLALEGSDAIEVLHSLSELKFRGTIQLMSGRGHDVMAHIFKIGEELGFRMLEPLMKPFKTSAIRQILSNENMMIEKAANAAIYELEESVLTGTSFWCLPCLSIQTRKLDHIEVNVRVSNPDLAAHAKIIDFKPETSNEQLLLFRHALAELSMLERELALTETPFSVIIPSQLNHWKSIKISSLINNPQKNAAKAHFIVLDFSEEDVFSDLAAARDIMVQLRIQNIRIRLSHAGYKLASLTGNDKLPLQEVVIDSELLNQRYEDHAHAAILKVIAYCKATGATALTGLVNSSVLGWVGKNGFDRYISDSLYTFKAGGNNASSEKRKPLDEFKREWSPYRTSNGSIIRRASPSDFSKAANN